MGRGRPNTTEREYTHLGVLALSRWVCTTAVRRLGDLIVRINTGLVCWVSAALALGSSRCHHLQCWPAWATGGESVRTPRGHRYHVGQMKAKNKCFDGDDDDDNGKARDGDGDEYRFTVAGRGKR